MVICVQGFHETFRANAFVPELGRGVGGWMMGRSDGAAWPSTPCSPAHARGQDKGIGNYSPDSFILPAVLEVCEPLLYSQGWGLIHTPTADPLIPVFYSSLPRQWPVVPATTEVCQLPYKTLKSHPCALCSLQPSENHWGRGCPPSSLQGGNVSGEAD